MKHDDPRLTAYVLGELDAEERANVEALIERDAAVREAVESIRATADLLEKELGAQPAPALESQRRQAILDAALGANRRRLTPRVAFAGMAAAAVCLVVAAASLYGLSRTRGGPQLAAIRAPEGPRRSEKRAPSVGDVPRVPEEVRGQLRSLGYLGDTSARSIDGIEEAAGIEEEEVARPPVKSEAENLRGLAMRTRPEPRAEADLVEDVQEPFNAVAAEYGPTLSASPGEAQVPTERLEETAGGGRLKARSVDQAYLLSVGEGEKEEAKELISGFVSPAVADEVPLLGDVSAFGYFFRDVPAGDDRESETIEARRSVSEVYAAIRENPFTRAMDNPVSTFAIDVDTASYANVRRFLSQRTLPPRDAVRIEELVNYFQYDYSAPEGGDPFAVHVELAACPWREQHRLARFGLKARDIPAEDRSAGNLVFLIDVSGSMKDANKLPLLKKAMAALVRQLTAQDRVTIVTYANDSRLALSPTPGDDKAMLLGALDALCAGGSTNGAAGIELAYDIAVQNFIEGGANRVILATDGDFNVGVTARPDLVRLIEDEAKRGVFLTVLGFGTGNLKDATLEALANKGNGHYAYIDTFNEARKVLVGQLTGTLVTVAKDVKVQVEFNPVQVAAYRLLGYENRALTAQDFNDDTRDAGEIGAGHTVTALYEIVPVGVETPPPGVDELKYQRRPPAPPTELTGSEELMTLKLRYKAPDADTSTRREYPVVDSGKGLDAASTDFRFAAAVAGFGLLLRDSPHKGQATYEAVIDLAQGARGEDPDGYRAEFTHLVRTAQALAGR